MKNYKAILFHPEGDYVTDFKDRNSIQDVRDAINDMGSRWIFYPIVFICTDKTIVDTPEQMEWMKGKRIKTIQKFFKSTWEDENNRDEICNELNAGFTPFIYQYQ